MIKTNFISKFKSLIVISAIIFLCKDSNSQPLFVENFNYSVRDSIENNGGWFTFGSVTNKKIKVVSPGLSFTGYLGSATGNTSHLSNLPEGDIALNSFPQQSSGTVYMSFILRVDSLSATATEGYNICLDEAGGSTNLNSRVYIKKVSSSTFNIGIKKGSGTTKYASTNYAKNTNYLVVCSYTFIAGVNNDIAKLYASGSGVPATEPAVPVAADTSGSDISNIGEVILTNSFVQSGLQGSSVKIDGIRIGTSWASTLLQQLNVNLDLKALFQGFYNSSLNKMVKDTARVYLRYNISPYNIADSSKAVLDSTGKGNFIFNRIGNLSPYFIVVKHRNSLVSWSKTAKTFYSNTLTYDFTINSSLTYGNNAVLSGSKYCFYSGDINQDGIIDAGDISAIENDAINSVSGYVKSDITGDNFVDASDLSLVENNVVLGVYVITP